MRFDVNTAKEQRRMLVPVLAVHHVKTRRQHGRPIVWAASTIGTVTRLAFVLTNAKAVFMGADVRQSFHHR